MIDLIDKQQVVAILEKIEHEADDAEWAQAAGEALMLLKRAERDTASLTVELNKAYRQIREDDEMIHTLLGIADSLTQVLERIVIET